MTSLHHEIENIRKRLRPAAVAALRDTARANGLGDISSARHQVDILDARLADLFRRQDAIERSRRTVRSPGNGAGPGDLLLCRDADGAQRRFHILFPEDGRQIPGAITPASPIGRALTGGSIGDSVDISTPRGSLCLTIEDIVAEPV